MIAIAKNLDKIRDRICLAAKKCGRDPKSIELVAVSKTRTVAEIKAAYDHGQIFFGENYVQELLQKAKSLENLDIEWHFIGHLQRNKVKVVAPFIKHIDSVDSFRLAEEINRRVPKAINCMIEVNIGNESSKSGIPEPEVPDLLTALNSMEKLNIVGLMTIPPFENEPESSRHYFRNLRELMNKLNSANIYRSKLTELSMGMTTDLEVAIEEGSTMVRVGTGIFGDRRVGVVSRIS